jgi:hypothetical protein
MRLQRVTCSIPTRVQPNTQRRVRHRRPFLVKLWAKREVCAPHRFQESFLTMRYRATEPACLARNVPARVRQKGEALKRHVGICMSCSQKRMAKPILTSEQNDSEWKKAQFDPLQQNKRR